MLSFCNAVYQCHLITCAGAILGIICLLAGNSNIMGDEAHYFIQQKSKVLILTDEPCLFFVFYLVLPHFVQCGKTPLEIGLRGEVSNV